MQRDYIIGTIFFRTLMRVAFPLPGFAKGGDLGVLEAAIRRRSKTSDRASGL